MKQRKYVQFLDNLICPKCKNYFTIIKIYIYVHDKYIDRFCFACKHAYISLKKRHSDKLKRSQRMIERYKKHEAKQFKKSLMYGKRFDNYMLERQRIKTGSQIPTELQWINPIKIPQETLKLEQEVKSKPFQSSIIPDSKFIDYFRTMRDKIKEAQRGETQRGRPKKQRTEE